MNKIYKLIWSKVKNMWVVASELAKSHTKSSNSGIVGSVSLAYLESKINMDLSKGFVAGVFPMVTLPAVKSSSFTITVAAIVKNEAGNVPTWVQAARSCADEIIVVDTGSTDGTVERFADYGIKCFHYDWNDDFASAKNYMISLCHGDWIVLLDGDEWFREGCDVRKAIAKHHNNPVTKAIIADWICLDKDRGNAVMFSGGAVRAFRNQSDVRYFRKVHENLTIDYENFAFEPEFKMYHTGYSGSVNRSKHERNLRIMRTMFDFDNGKVEYPTDWRYIEDTYAGLGEFDKALWAADKMISYGVQEYSAAAWITKFNVLFAMKTPMEEMRKQFKYCFKTVPSVSGFRFLASIYYIRNGLVAEGLDNYIEGLRLLMGPQDKVAMEHTYWRMYMPEASAFASAVYLQNKQFEASLYACKVCEQYCGQTDWTNRVLVDVYRVMNQTEEGLLGNISEWVLPVLQFAKKGVLATAIASSLTVGMVGVPNPVFAACCNVNGVTTNQTTGNNATVTGGQQNTANCDYSSVSGGRCNTASGDDSSVSGGYCNTASGFDSSVSGGYFNTACGNYSSVSGGRENVASGYASSVFGGCNGFAYACYSTVIGGGIAGNADCFTIALGSVAIGKGAQTTTDYEVAIGSADAPVKIDGALTVDGTKAVTDGTNSKTWEEILSGNGIKYVGINPHFEEWTDSNAEALKTKYNVQTKEEYDVLVANGLNIHGEGAVGDNSIAIGNGVVSRYDNSIAIGNNAYADLHSVVLGNEVIASDSGSAVVIGDRSKSTGFAGVALGYKSEASYDGVAIGDQAMVTFPEGIAIGMHSTAGSTSVSIGKYAVSDNGSFSVAVGPYAEAQGGSSVAVGYLAKTSNDSSGGSTAVGTHAEATGSYASAFGSYAKATANQSLALSEYSEASGSFSSAVGYSAKATGQYALAVGNDSKATADKTVVVGGSAVADKLQNTAVGYASSAKGDYSMAFGSYSNATADYSSALGYFASAQKQYGTTLGTYASVGGEYSTALGASSVANADNTTAVGYGSGARAKGATALGKYAGANAEDSLALGRESTVSGKNSVALGVSSLATEENVVSLGKDAVGIEGQDGYVAEVTRKVQHVTAGVNDTDAVNVKQLNDQKVEYVGVNAVWKDWADLTDDEKTTLGVTTETEYNEIVAGSNRNGEGAVGDNTIAIGNNAKAGTVSGTTILGDNAVAIGTNANAMYNNSLALGTDSKASTNAVAIGNQANASRNSWASVAIGYKTESAGDSLAIGEETTALGNYAVALGYKANSAGTESIAIGKDAKAIDGSETIAIGSGAVTGSSNAIALGDEAVAGGFMTVAVGHKAVSTNSGSVSIGQNPISSGTQSVAIGTQANAVANNTIAIGLNSKANNKSAVALGDTVTASGERSIAIGGAYDYKTTSDGYVSVAIGSATHANSDYTTAVGSGACATGQYATAYGNNSFANGEQAIALGQGSNAKNKMAVALGTSAYTEYENATVVGSQVMANGKGSTVLGNSSNANAENAVAIGHNAYANNKSSIAIGDNINVTSDSAIGIGNCTYANAARSIALGSNSQTLEADTLSIGKNAVGTEGQDGYVPEYTRKIQHVTAGINDTDAVNVKQLNDAKTKYFGVNSSDFTGQANTNISGAGAIGSDSVAIGKFASACGACSVAIGICSSVTDVLGVALGAYATAGDAGVAIGGDITSGTFANGASVAIGSGARAEGVTSTALNKAQALGRDAIAVGYEAYVSGDYAIGIGNAATVMYTNGIAIGYNSSASEDSISMGNLADSNDQAVALGMRSYAQGIGSVALGSQSVASDDYVVSLGSNAVTTGNNQHAEINRRIVHLAAGVNDTDAVNVSQLNDGLYDKANWDASNIGRNLLITESDYPDGLTEAQKAEYASTQREYNLRSWGQALGAGTVTGGDARLVTGDTLHVEVRPAENGTYVKTNNTTGQNLLALDQQLSTVLEGTASQNTAISDLQNEMDTKANVGLDNITDAGKTVVRDLAKESVKVVNGTNTTVTEGTDGNAKTYAVNAVTDGVVADGNTGIVTGGTVYSAIQDMIASSGSSEGKANVALDNVTEAGHTVIKTDAKSAVNVAGNSDVTVTKTDVDGVDMYNVAVVKTGTVSDGNEGIVTGDTVYDALKAETRPSADGNYITTGNTAGANLTALDAQVKMNTDAVAAHTTDITNLKDLSNITDAGQTVVQNLAKGSVNVVGSDKATVTKTDVNGVDTYMVSVKNDGLVASGNAGLVSGGTVYDALVAETRPAADGNYVATDRTAGANLTALDTQVKTNADAIAAVTDGMDGKANTSLDNVTSAGQDVIRTLAKGSVKVVDGTHTTVTEGTDGDAKTYVVNVSADGSVADGDIGIVTGGAVYNALQMQASDMATALDTKANKDASNITDAEAWGTKIATGSVAENDVRAISGDTAYRMKTALETAMNTGLDSKADNDLSNLTDPGQAVIQQKAISSVKVGDGDNTTVSSETDADGSIIYKVKANATGTVAANDTGLVDGGTVYEALENTKSEMTGNISGKADKDLGNITDAGKEVVKDLAKDSVSVESGTNAEVVKTDVNGVDTYTVNVAGNGQVSENDTGLVNGGTVYTELRPTDGIYVRKDATTAANLSALDTKIGTVTNGDFVQSANTVGQNLNALDEALYDKANWDASNIGRNLPIAESDYPDGLTADQKAEYASTQRDYNLRSWGQALGAGTVTGGDSRLITGDTLHVEVRPANSGTYVGVDKTTGENLLALDEQLSSVVSGSSAQSTAISGLENEMANKANIALDNINADGVNVVRNIAKSAVVVADGPNTTVSSSTDTDGNITYRVTANATGSVTDGSTGLVDGGMVYTAIENAKGSMGGDIGGLDADGNYIRKANTVAQNLVVLDTQVKTNADGLAVEQTARETADTVLNNRIGTLTADGNYIVKDSPVSENLSRLDTAVKTAGDTADANAAAITDLKDLSNITAAGETVIKNLSKGSVKVINGTNSTVTEGMDGDVKTFAVNVASNGAVADGDTGLVSGGTVKSALDALSGSVDAGLSGKVNVSLDNVTDAGHAVIKSDAKSAVNVVGSNRAAVTKTDVNGVDTYMVDVKADGEILADNKGLVDGGTVFDAVAAVTWNIIDYTNDRFDGKANVELDNLAVTGHAVIKSDAKSAVNVVGGQYATVAKTDVDGVDTYTVNVATDGSVADGDEKLVTGGTVYDALQGIRSSVDTAMAGKANTSLDNLDVAGVGRVRDIAKTAVSVVNGAHTTASSETGADGNVTYRVNVDLNGSVAFGNNGIVSGGGIYNELRPADGNYVAQSNTTAANLTALDVAVKEAMTKAETAQAAAGGNVVIYDGDDKSAVTLGGTDGTVIHNVADGAVSADSKDAVNGGQLYTVKSAVDANTTAIAGLDTKIQDHATAIAGLDIRVQDNATAIAGLDTRVQDNATAIAGLDTRVQDNATAIDTLRTTVTDGLNGKSDTDLGNLSDTGKEMVRDLAKGSVRVADGLNTTVRTTVDGDASVYHVDVAANGRVESGNAGIVTGDAVYEALRDLELNASDTHYVSVNPSERDDETYTNHGASGADAVAIGAKSYACGVESVAIGHNNDVSGNETYVIGSDVNATGNNSVVLGKGSDGSLDNVVSVGSSGNERRIVHVADGELSADSKDAVNGKQLYEVREKLQNAEGIDVDKWSDVLGAGSVAPDDERLVKGSTVYSAIQSFSGISLSPDGSTLHVGTNNTATVVDFSNSEGKGRVLQGIVTDPDNPNSAANVGYVNAVGQNIINGVNNSLNRMDTRIDKVGAGAAALASLEPMPFDDDQKWSISVAIGTYHGTQAGAVGVFYKPQDNVMLNIRGAVGNGENMGGAGLSIGLNKGAAKGLSKASMAKAMNAQANEIVAQKQLIQNQQAQLDAQKAEIEELKQMVRSVVASKQVDK